MISVDLKRVPEGKQEYVTVATVTVADDGKVTTHDPHGFLPVDLSVLVREGSSFRKVSFDDDPATWARNLHTVLRTGYLVPTVTVDTEVAR